MLSVELRMVPVGALDRDQGALLASWLSMIFSENRFPLFGIML